MDGIGMGVGAYYGKTDLSKVSIALTHYATDTLGTEVRWVFPMSVYESFRTNVGYERTHLKTENAGVSREVSAFVRKQGHKLMNTALAQAGAMTV